MVKWQHFFVVNLNGQNFRERIDGFNDGWLLRSIHIHVYLLLRKQFTEVHRQSLALSASTIDCKGTRANAVDWKDGVKSSAPVLEGNLIPVSFMTQDGASKPSALMKTFAVFSVLIRHCELVVLHAMNEQ